jgi:hypothetical protein
MFHKLNCPSVRARITETTVKWNVALKVAKLNITQIKRLHLAIPSFIIIIQKLKSEKFFRQFQISMQTIFLKGLFWISKHRKWETNNCKNVFFCFCIIIFDKCWLIFLALKLYIFVLKQTNWLAIQVLCQINDDINSDCFYVIGWPFLSCRAFWTLKSLA